MELDLAGKVVAVTGGGGALGRETAALLAEQGAAVALLDLNEEALGDAAAVLADKGTSRLTTALCDVTARDSVEAAFAHVAAALGPIDILVNNAGFSRDKYLTKMDEADWDIVHDVVLKGAFHCSRAVLPGMMARRWGRIVNISSMAYLGNKGQTNYSAAKAGLVGMTNALAREAGSFNITVNAVAPGLIATPRLRARPDYAKLEERSLGQVPLPRLGEPLDVAKAVLFFASPLADFVTAQCLHVSGGR